MSAIEKVNRKKGLLVINLGTPESPEPDEVGEYLREFLMDKYVITLPFLIRWILVNVIIVPRRKFYASKNYKKIWTDEGSPLSFLTMKLANRLATYVSDKYEVRMSMRYAQPSMRKNFLWFKENGITDIILWPLYPHYAESTVRTTYEFAAKLNKEFNFKIKTFQDFYDKKFFIDSLVESIKPVKFDHLLMSFHGLPVSHLRNTEGSKGYCKQNACCETITASNSKCYRAQCIQTSLGIAKGLSLSSERYSVSFQSRIGPAEWLSPSTEDTVKKLALLGVKNLAVTCPAFVVDCLETLEEIQDQMTEIFKHHGGETLTLIPCLNDNESWVKNAASWIEREEDLLSIC